MTKKDQRSPAQRKTHVFAVVARDSFLSNWGRASGGESWCAWAFEDKETAEKFEPWVRAREEMRDVELVDLRTWGRPYPPRCVHLSVHPADENHPGFRALKEEALA